MNCKECYHYKICHLRISLNMDYDEVSNKYITDIENRCDNFKNAAYIIELPPEAFKTVGEQLGKLLSHIVDDLPDVVNELMTDSEFIKNGIMEAFKE